MTGRDVLVTGGTGYIGQALVPALVACGHRVRVLARPGSCARVPPGAEAVPGDALDPASIAAVLRPYDAVVHLVGTPHPSPAKAAQFQAVDRASVLALADAAAERRPSHVIYVSVARPAPVMRAYQAVRAEGERALTAVGVAATIVRPWYVLGPGHRWPLLLVPLYAAAGLVPALRAGAVRLGLVTRGQLVRTLVEAVETPPAHGAVRVLGVPEIRGGLRR